MAERARSIPIRIGIAWAGIGNGVYLASQYVMLMTIAKLGNPTLVGEFSLAMAIAAPLFLFSQMQLRQAQVTDAKDEFCFADYFWCRTFSTALAMAGIGLVIVCSGYSGDMAWLIILIGLAKAFESVSDIAHGRLQRHERLDLVAVSLGVKGPVSAAVLAVTLWLTGSLLWAFATVTFVWGAVLFFFDMPLQARIHQTDASLKGVRIIAIRRLVVTALPLAIAGGLASLSGNIPRYVLEVQQGKEAVALFSVAAAPLTLLTLLLGAVSQASLARVAEYFQKGEGGAFRRLAWKIAGLQLTVSVAFVVATVIWGEWLIAVMFTPEYRGAAPVLVIMSAGLAVGSMSAFAGIVLSASRAFRLQLLNIVLVIIFQIPSAFLLIRGYGVNGAGWAELGRYAWSSACLAIMAYLLLSSRPNAVRGGMIEKGHSVC